MEVEPVVVPSGTVGFEFLAVYDNCHDMALVGSFNGWNREAHKMHIKIPGLWSVFLQLNPEEEHEFRFIVDGCRWTNVPHYAVNTAGNHVIRLPAQEVLFELTGEDWEKPQISGTFTSWTRLDMPRQRDCWVHKAYLHDGDYQFKFVKSGNWVTSPTYPVNADGNNVISVGPGTEGPAFTSPEPQEQPATDKANEELEENGNDGNGSGNGKESSELHYHFHIEPTTGQVAVTEKDMVPQQTTPEEHAEDEHNEGNLNQPSKINTNVQNDVVAV